MKKIILSVLSIVLVTSFALTMNVKANAKKQITTGRDDVQSVSEIGNGVQIIIDDEHQRVAECKDDKFLYRSTNNLDSQIVTVETFDLKSGNLVDTTEIDLSSVSAEGLVR